MLWTNLHLSAFILPSLLILHFAEASPATSQAARTLPKPVERSYVKLFTLVGWGKVVDPSDDKTLRFIADNYAWINGHAGSWYKGVQAWEFFAGPSNGTNAEGMTIAQQLKKMNPDIILSSYRSSQHTNQHSLTEGPEAEREIPLAIGLWDSTQRLVKPIDDMETVIQLTPFKDAPEGSPAIYPWKISTTKGEHSIDKSQYVTWLRIGNEIMRINDGQADAQGVVTLKVARGIWATSAAAHDTNAPVFQPIYYGGKNRQDKEYYLSGRPDNPSPERGLYYNMMMNNPEFWDWLGDKTQEIIDEGYDGPWYDEAVSNWIVYCNAYGDHIPGHYNLETGEYDTHDSYLVHQQKKIDYIYRRFPGIKIYVNWIFPKYYWDEGGGHVKRLFTGEGGYHPIDGGSIEMYANRNYMDWHDLMRMQMDMRDNNYTFNCWAKFSGGGGDWDMSEQYQVFSYATYLLAQDPEVNQSFGGLFHRPSNEGGSSDMWTFKPFDVVFWDLGEPKEKFWTIGEAEMKDALGVYRRRYSKGIVLVNPDPKQSKKVVLEEELYDVTKKAWVRQLTMAPESGAILLRE